MPSAKQQPSHVKHGGAIRPNVWVLTFGPPCIYNKYTGWVENSVFFVKIYKNLYVGVNLER